MGKVVRQAGVVAVRGDRVCVINSRSGARTVIPKGHIDPGHTPAEAARIEAWEEAGLTGTLSADPVGEYGYDKFGQAYTVSVFLMTEVAEAGDWPEARERTRQWLSFGEAARRVGEPGLRRILEGLAGAAVGA